MLSSSLIDSSSVLFELAASDARFATSRWYWRWYRVAVTSCSSSFIFSACSCTLASSAASALVRRLGGALVERAEARRTSRRSFTSSS